MNKKYDFLLVGYGVASLCFAYECVKNQHSFYIISDFEASSSHIAAGVYNPVVLKRFSPIWNAIPQLEKLKETFKGLEALLKNTYIHPMPVYRIFSNSQEQNIWKNKIKQNLVLEEFLNPNVIANTYDAIAAPYGFGEVKQTGWIDLLSLLNDFQNKYPSSFLKESFDYTCLQGSDTEVIYNDITAKHIVFAEGIKAKNNPFFSNLPLVENKGEILLIESDADLPNVIFKSKNFLMPIGNKKYFVGATYDREFDTVEPTLVNQTLLIKKLNHYFKGNYRIIDHKSAVRPTVIDRKPIIGKAKHLNHGYILNGMGTRGTFLAPTMADVLYRHITCNAKIPDSINVNRFD